MTLLALGLNHTTAPLAVRERVSFGPESLVEGLRQLRAAFGPAVREAAIVSTCNRTEVYCSLDAGKAGGLHAQSDHAARVGAWLADIHKVRPDDLAPHLYAHPEQLAVRHAFRVASGLDSMVVGETQILGQMKQAVKSAEEAGALGTLLNQLFQRTFAVAKEVRTQTEIGARSVSMAAAAVRVAERIFPDIAELNVLFIGAGEMIELGATHFAARAPRRIVVANRTVERAHVIASRVGGTSMRLADLADRLAEFDVVVSSTASSLPIIGLGMVERALKARRRKPIFMVDLAVPRDVESEVARLADVYLYTVDDLGEIVREGASSRQAAVAQAEAIIESRVQNFMQWLDRREALPLIADIRAAGDAIRADELDRAMRLLASGGDPSQVLDELSRRIANKFMHRPLTLLGEADREERARLADLLPRLFPVDRT